MDGETTIEKVLLKTSKKYSEDKLVKIEGQGEKGHTIYYAYLSAIGEGYDLTIEESCHYIGCSYTYFITRLIDKIYHIRINTAARKLIYLYGNINGGLDEDVQSLVNKRILLNRDDFFTYMRSNIIIEQQYKVLTFDNFDVVAIDEIQKNLDIYNSKNEKENYDKTLISLLYDVVMVLSEKNKPMRFTLPEGYEMPEKFYSLKEIKSRWGINHDIEVYRMLDANGARKYMLCGGDFVRYDIREFERNGQVLNFRPGDIIKIDYQSYLKLSKKYGDVVQEIQKQALNVSRKLAGRSSKRL